MQCNMVIPSLRNRRKGENRKIVQKGTCKNTPMRKSLSEKSRQQCSSVKDDQNAMENGRSSVSDRRTGG